ncbi:MAG TPA: site-specific integrase [Acidimicrobiales bacterium]|nr:site-specific integrase [Acidimicrobiales bacterium]
MSRRQFGAVRRLPSGRWQVRYLQAGKHVPAPITFRTKAEANRWLSELETDTYRGRWIDPRLGKITLREYSEAWLRGRANLAPRTREIDAAQLRLYVYPKIDPEIPALGEVSIADLTPELIRSWYGALKVGRGRSVAPKAYVRLRQILSQAVDDERIGRNPCRIPGGGVERSAEQRFASVAELVALAEAVPDRYRALVLTAGLGGLRQGELFALRRRDLDLDNGTITVRRKRLRLASGEVVEDHPKSDAGRRVVAVPPQLVAELRRHLAVHARPGSDAYVFTSPEGTPLERSNFRLRVWEPATHSAGVVGMRFHDLRHTAGTLAAQTGATTKELMVRLGHASSRAAMIYQHAADDRDRLIAERLGAMVADAGLILPCDTDDQDEDRDAG